jgi:hypothetical protein
VNCRCSAFLWWFKPWPDLNVREHTEQENDWETTRLAIVAVLSLREVGAPEGELGGRTKYHTQALLWTDTCLLTHTIRFRTDDSFPLTSSLM